MVGSCFADVAANTPTALVPFNEEDRHGINSFAVAQNEGFGLPMRPKNGV
jgi:hypothetical protein